MTEVWLFRHGQSTANAGEPTRDPVSTPLTPLGLAQSRRAAESLARPPDLIVHSSYLRARQTAEAFSQRFPEVPVECWPVHEFTYLAPARYAGTTADQRRPMVDAYWDRLDPDFVDGEGAESFAGFTARVREALERLRALCGLVVVCSHGQFLRGALCGLLDGVKEPRPTGRREMALFRGLRQGVDIPNAALLRVRLGNPDWLGGVDLGHLRGGPLPL